MYLPRNASKTRVREATNARENRREIVKALSHGQVTRRDMVKMGLMTAAGWDFYRNEWWHYQLFDARRYPLISDADLPRPML